MKGNARHFCGGKFASLITRLPNDHSLRIFVNLALLKPIVLNGPVLKRVKEEKWKKGFAEQEALLP